MPGNKCTFNQPEAAATALPKSTAIILISCIFIQVLPVQWVSFSQKIMFDACLNQFDSKILNVISCTLCAYKCSYISEAFLFGYIFVAVADL